MAFWILQGQRAARWVLVGSVSIGTVTCVVDLVAGQGGQVLSGLSGVVIMWREKGLAGIESGW